MRKRPIKYNPEESEFLGIFEGKKRKAAADARAKEEEAKRATFALQMEAAKNGYNPEKQKADSAIKLEETKQKSDSTLYITIAVIIVVVMVGLYFIKKRS